jgi:hypothetical protein
MRVRSLSRREVKAGGGEGTDAVISICGSVEAPRRDAQITAQQVTRGESAGLKGPIHR